MLIKELKVLPKEKHGRFIENTKIEKHEKRTCRYLLKFGFNIETINPVNISGTNNPDILISGAIWEIKSPFSYNKQTLKNRMKKASKQASRVIFDLRNIKNGYDKAEYSLIKLFYGNTRIRRMIIIKKNGKTLDFRK